MASAVVFILSCGLLVVSGKDLRAHFDDDGGTTCGYSVSKLCVCFDAIFCFNSQDD